MVTAFVVRFWLYEEPVERLELGIPADASFQYWRTINLANESHFVMAPEVPSDTGQAIINLLDGSERFVVEGDWTFRLDWPPIRKSIHLVSPAPGVARLDVLTTDAEDTDVQIEFLSDSSFFAPTGWFIVPEEDRAELRVLLDALDTQCQAAYEQQQSETPTMITDEE